MNIEYPLNLNDNFESFERECKGWLSDVIVNLDDGSRHKLFFYDPVRLTQDLEADVKSGKAGITEKNLFVVPKVTEKYIEASIKQAIREGYFESNL